MGAVRSIESYRLGPFELQPDKRRLLKDGAAISLRPRAFDLLAALVDRAGHLVTKDELLDRVWPKMVVEESRVARAGVRPAQSPRRRCHHHGVGTRLPMVSRKTVVRHGAACSNVWGVAAIAVQ
jgi:DNA-binding response OmpR family regulator